MYWLLLKSAFDGINVKHAVNLFTFLGNVYRFSSTEYILCGCLRQQQNTLNNENPASQTTFTKWKENKIVIIYVLSKVQTHLKAALLVSFQ